MQQKTPVQARLQRRIIFSLDMRPAESVSELARRIEGSRPSVSRALGTLAARGLVERAGRAWLLTQSGQAELQAMTTGVSKAMLRAVTQDRNLQLAMGHDLARTAQAIVSSAAFGADLERFSALNIDRLVPLGRIAADWGRTQDSVMVSAATNLDRRISKLFQAALPAGNSASVASLMEPAFKAMLGAQKLQADVIRQAADSGRWWNQIAAEGLVPSSRIIADMSVLPNLLNAHFAVGELLGKRITSGLSAVVAANAAHSTAMLSNLPIRIPDRPSAFVRDLTIPPAGTAALVSGTRQLLTPARAGSRREDLRGLPDLERLIAASDAEAAAEWHAAWHTLERRGPGWSRGSAHHARECLRLILLRLAPKDAVGRDQGSTTQSAQVMYVLRGGRDTLAEWAVAQGNAVRATYTALSAEAHAPTLSATGLASIIEAAGSLIQLLLTFTPDNPE